MEEHLKLQIYRGMIQYLMESVNYTLKDIADLSHSSIKHIRSVYCDNRLPSNFTSELRLIEMYHFILELQKNKRNLTQQVA